MILQWATYQDASDQTSLSRIWGGIHPPADDIPGRIIGEKIALQSFAKAEELFGNVITAVDDMVTFKSQLKVYPNPSGESNYLNIEMKRPGAEVLIEVYDLQGKAVFSKSYEIFTSALRVNIETTNYEPGLYIVKAIGQGYQFSEKVLID